mgnify:CR=1 FL=1
MKTQTYFCPQLERRVTSEEFNDAKKILLKNLLGKCKYTKNIH